MAANDIWGTFCVDLRTFLSSNQNARNEVIKDICRRDNDMSTGDLESWIYKHPRYMSEFEPILKKHNQTELLKRIGTLASALEQSGKKNATSDNAPKVRAYQSRREDSPSMGSDYLGNKNDDNISQQVEEVRQQSEQGANIGANSEQERSASVDQHGNEISELAEQVRKCEETLSDINKEVEELKDQIRTKDTEIAKLMAECDRLKVAVQSMIDIIREKDNEIQILRTERDRLQMTLDNVEAQSREQRSIICNIQ